MVPPTLDTEPEVVEMGVEQLESEVVLGGEDLAVDGEADPAAEAPTQAATPKPVWDDLKTRTRAVVDGKPGVVFLVSDNAMHVPGLLL